MNLELIAQWKHKLLTDPPESFHRGGLYFGEEDGTPIATNATKPHQCDSYNACALGKLMQIIGVESMIATGRDHMLQIKEHLGIAEYVSFFPIIEGNDHKNATGKELVAIIDKTLGLK